MESLNFQLFNNRLPHLACPDRGGVVTIFFQIVSHELSFADHIGHGFFQTLRGLDFAVAAIHSGEYDLVILDEINVATYFELLDPKEVLSKVDGHEGVEVVFTGRRAPPEFLAAADLVTVMELVKHPYDKGVDARKGVEF